MSAARRTKNETEPGELHISEQASEQIGGQGTETDTDHTELPETTPAGETLVNQTSSAAPPTDTATALAWKLVRSASVPKEGQLAEALTLAAGRWGPGIRAITLSGGTLSVQDHAGAVTTLPLDSHDDLERAAHELARVAGEGDFPSPGVLALRGEETLNAAAVTVIRALHGHARTYQTAPLASGKHAQVVFWGDETGRWCEATARPGGELSSSAAELQSDAAWTALSRIKNRQLRGELMRKSEQGGIIKALLSARRAGVGDALLARPEAVLAPLRVILPHGDESPAAIATRAAQELAALQAQAATSLADLIMSAQPGEE